MKPPPDPLDHLLNCWSETPEPPGRLTQEVWQRIALAEEKSPAAGGWWLIVEGWFARPPFAVMFVASCALIGLFLAEVRVNHLQRERNGQLARSYLQLIDPLITVPSPPPQP